MNPGESNEERIKVDFTQVYDTKTLFKMADCAMAQYNANMYAAITKTTTDKVAIENAKVAIGNAKVAAKNVSDIIATSTTSFTFSLNGTTTVVTASTN